MSVRRLGKPSFYCFFQRVNSYRYGRGRQVYLGMGKPFQFTYIGPFSPCVKLHTCRFRESPSPGLPLLPTSPPSGVGRGAEVGKIYSRSHLFGVWTHLHSPIEWFMQFQVGCSSGISPQATSSISSSNCEKVVAMISSGTIRQSILSGKFSWESYWLSANLSHFNQYVSVPLCPLSCR